MAAVEIFTDGACSGNPGAGGWAVILRYGATEKELCGGAPETTNNRMELTAVIEALKALKRECDLIIHTDSRYVMDGVQQWLPNWVKGHNGHLENERVDKLARDEAQKHCSGNS